MELHNRERPSVSKGAPVVTTQDVEIDLSIQSEVRPSASTRDQADMARMGKKQELIRSFRTMAAVSFTTIATGSWELAIFILTQGLVDGGRANLIYSIIWNFVLFCPVYLSMAEMASMAPISGGQFHWVSEFAHPDIQQWLSYITGWTSSLSWQAGNAVGCLFTGILIQVVILENNDDYGFPPWQGTLLVLGVISCCAVFLIYGSKYVAPTQIGVMVVQVLAFFAFIIVLWTNAPQTPASVVMTEFSNSGGWSSMGLAVLVGQLSGISTQVGIDTTVHISEEVEDASRSVPRSMLGAWVFNFVTTIAADIAVCFAMPNLKAALNDPSGFPVIYVLRGALPKPWLTIMLTVIIFLLMCSNISYLVAVTRDLWAFGRDNGLPFSRWLSEIHPRRHVPVNAIIFSSVFCFALCLIYIGSPDAFYAITSLSVVSLLQCYMISIGSILWRRIAMPDTLPPCQFSLGRYGVPINAVAVFWCAWCFFWSFWPIATPVTAAGFNWSSVIYVAVLAVSMVWYFLKARFTYKGPVVDVACAFE